MGKLSLYDILCTAKFMCATGNAKSTVIFHNNEKLTVFTDGCDYWEYRKGFIMWYYCTHSNTFVVPIYHSWHQKARTEKAARILYYLFNYKIRILFAYRTRDNVLYQTVDNGEQNETTVTLKEFRQIETIDFKGFID